jgi:prepilin-type N-terminal cleavage/methylation domain-containing protein
MRVRWQADAGVTLIEMLVVMVIFGVISASITGVLITAQRSEQFQGEMQEVMDDARISFQRMRREVRAARQVYATSCVSLTVDASGDYTNCSPTGKLHFWVDQDQDAIVDPVEVICYFTESIGTGQWQLVRWDSAAAGCDAANRPTNAGILAQTLVNPLPFRELTPHPYADPDAEPTRQVRVVLDLEVVNLRGPRSRAFESIIRLRNVA